MMMMMMMMMMTVGGMSSVYRCMSADLTARDFPEDLLTVSRIILKWILRSCSWRYAKGFICLKIGVISGRMETRQWSSDPKEWGDNNFLIDWATISFSITRFDSVSLYSNVDSYTCFNNNPISCFGQNLCWQNRLHYSVTNIFQFLKCWISNYFL
jgi:hypothetical protein